MIVIRLSSGMGNQLFMYAFYLYIKKKYESEEVYFDDKYYKSDSFGRKAELSILFPDYPVWKFKFNPAGELKFRRILFGWKQRLFPSFQYVKEKDYNDNLHYKGNVYFDGYWQTEKYIHNIDISDFTPKEFLPDVLIPYANYISQATNAVSIHFRRTDYFSPKYIHRFGVCTDVYYQKAMESIESVINKPIYFVFSDDLEWVKDNIHFNAEYILIPNFDVNPFWYIHLMSKCKHHIISNSTFSWWGAFLNPYKDKMVMAPNRWLLDSNETIVLNEWNKIDVK